MPVTTLKLLLECREIVSRPVKGGTANSGKSAENGPEVVFFLTNAVQCADFIACGVA